MLHPRQDFNAGHRKQIFILSSPRHRVKKFVPIRAIRVKVFSDFAPLKLG